MSETTASVNGRTAEIVFLIVIALLVALGGNVILHLLDANRVFGAIVLGVAFIGAVAAIRRAYVPGSASVRRDVTKAAAYAAATGLAFLVVAFHLHWAIGASIAAFEAALVFDIITIVARPRATGGTAQPR